MKGVFKGGQKKFNVRFYKDMEGKPNETLYTEEEMTYFEVATYILTHEIKRIDIRED